MSAVYRRSTKFKRGNPACRLYYATTGTWTGDSVLEGRLRAVTDDLTVTNPFREVTFIPLGADGIQKFYRQTKNAIEREFLFENRVTIPDVPGVTQAYLGFLPVPELMVPGAGAFGNGPQHPKSEDQPLHPSAGGLDRLRRWYGIV
jgi:hypothetical protein